MIVDENNIEDINENHTLIDHPSSKFLGFFRDNELKKDFTPSHWQEKDLIYFTTDSLTQLWENSKVTGIFNI